MNTERHLAVQPSALTPDIWHMLRDIAPVMHKSRLFGVTSEEAAVAIMLRGYELGLGLTASFDFITVISGKPSLTPRGALAIIYQSGELADMKMTKLTDTNGAFCGYEVWMKRRNGIEHRTQFTVEDAQRAGLIKPNSAWVSYPLNMCLWRAVGFCADVVFPDITGGMTTLMKTPEQYGVGFSEVGDVVEGVWSVAPTNGTSSPAPAPAPEPVAPAHTEVITLNKLLEAYTAEQILVANEGKIPGTDEEVAAVAKKLGGA